MAIIVAILTVVMSVGAVSATPAMGAANYTDTELSRAVNLCFGTYRSDNPAVTYAQFMTMLDKAFELTDKNKLTTWQTKYTDARKSKKTINRGNPIIGVFAAAETLGGEVYSRNCEDRGQGTYSGEWNAEKFWGNVYGWSSDPKFMSPVNTYHKAGETWAFAIGGTAAGVKNMVVKDNVFYLSNGGYLVHVPDMYESLCDVTFSGNTYVQNDNRKILSNEISKNSLTVGAIQRDLEQFLGDKKAVVLPPSVSPARQTK